MVVSERAERRPKPGTKYAVVFDALQAGVPRKDLPVATGLPRSDVSIVMRNLRYDGYLPKPTSEDKKTARKEGVEIFRGGLISDIIKPYVGLGMSRREIKSALDQENPDNNFSSKQISDSLGKGRSRGYFRRLTKAEQHDINFDARVGDEQIEQRVSRWLEVRKLLIDNDSKLPKSRIEWR